MFFAVFGTGTQGRTHSALGRAVAGLAAIAHANKQYFYAAIVVHRYLITKRLAFTVIYRCLLLYTHVSHTGIHTGDKNEVHRTLR